MKLMFLIPILLLLLLTSCSNQPKVCFDNTCFNAEIAESQEERQLGLMFREQLDEDAGMLFIFESERNYPFWMKNTLIPLDMIWINSDKEIVYIAKNVQPCKADPCPSVVPSGNALYVFEVNAGVTDAKGIFVGDEVKLP